MGSFGKSLLGSAGRADGGLRMGAQERIAAMKMGLIGKSRLAGGLAQGGGVYRPLCCHTSVVP
jgi:hypothetical protein